MSLNKLIEEIMTPVIKLVYKKASPTIKTMANQWTPKIKVHTPYHIRLRLGQRFLDSAYQNFTPLSYQNQPKFGIKKGRELRDTVVGFITGKHLNDTNPAWKKRLLEYIEAHPEAAQNYSNPSGLSLKGTINFRDEAWRLATNKNKYKGKLYKLNPNDTYSYDLDEVERIRAATGSTPFKGGNIVLKGNTPENVGIPITRIANDPVTFNGGFVSVETIPERLISSNNQYYLGTPSYTIRDVWDLQPFKDSFRSFGGEKLHKLMPKKLKNMEVLKALGGNPFVLEQKIPAGTSNMWILPLKMK